MVNVFPDRVVLSSKRKIGTDHKYNIGTEILTPIDVAALILKQVQDSLNAEFLEKATVVVGIPARFKQNERRDTKTAIERIFSTDKKNSVELVEEPFAAALNHIYSTLQEKSLQDLKFYFENKQRRILVIDIGGGTLDVTLVEVLMDNVDIYDKNDPSTYPKITKLSISDTYDKCAGIDFDTLIALDLLRECLPELESEILEKKDMRWTWLLAKAEEIKLKFSRVTKKNITGPIKSKIKAPFIETVKTSTWDYQRFFSVLSPLFPKEEFSFFHDHIQKYYDNIESYKGTIIYPIIQACYLNKKDIAQYVDDKIFDEIILTGGMAKFPILKDVLDGVFDSSVITEQKFPEHTVAKGLIIYQFLNPTKKIKSRLNHSYAIQVKDPISKSMKWEPILDRHLELPITKKSIETKIVIPPGLDHLRIPFGRRLLDTMDYEYIYVYTKKISPSQTPSKLYLDIFVSESEYFEFTPKADGIDGRILGEKITANDILIGNGNRTDISKKISTSRVIKASEIREKLEKIKKPILNKPRASKKSGKWVLQQFKKSLENIRQRNLIKQWRKMYSTLPNMEVNLERVISSFNAKINFIPGRHLNEKNSKMAKEYFLLLADLVNEIVKRKEDASFATEQLEPVIADTIDYMLPIEDYRFSDAFLSLLRNIRETDITIVFKDEGLLIQKLILQEKEGSWIDNLCYLSAMQYPQSHSTLYALSSIYSNKTARYIFRSYELIAKRIIKGHDYDRDIIQNLWHSLLIQFYYNIERQYDFALPFLPSEVYSESYLDKDSLVEIDNIGFMHVFTGLTYLAKLEYDYSEKDQFSKLLRYLFETDTMEDTLHYRAQLCLAYLLGDQFIDDIELSTSDFLELSA